MVQLAFFLRFRLQLRRTRPNLVPRLEDMAVQAVREAGGEIIGKNGTIRAAFNENSPGFWLDMLLLIERMTRIVDGDSSDLHGHSVLLGVTLPDTSDRLCRILSGGFYGGGVYLDQTTAEALRPYVTVEEQGTWAGDTFFKLKEEKIFVSTARSGFILPEKTIRLFEMGRRPSVLVVGRFFEGRRDNLYRSIAGFSNAGAGVPPLFVRFGSGGLNAIADAWPEWVSQDDTDRETWEKITAMREFIFRHRLRGEPSPFVANMARDFFDTLLTLYGNSVVRGGIQPVVILENLRVAEQVASDIVIAALSKRKDFILAGVCTEEAGEAGSSKWESLFPRKFRAQEKETAGRPPPELPADLWEIGYLCLLIGRIFPPYLIPGVLEEMGKNPEMLSRAISLLHALRVIDTPLDPRPWQDDFLGLAEAALGPKKDGLRALVRKRLLAWVAQKKINPCVSLLERLAELGGSHEIDDSLILQSIHGELGCTDGTALERFVDTAGTPEAVVGQARVPVIRYIAKTLLALHFGSEQKIRDTFASPPPECMAFPLLKTQVFLNQSLYHLGWHDGESAKRTVKAATLLCQKSGNSWLSRCHRFFALASLSERRIGETNEYLGFALENAVKSGDPQEIGIASFYTASVQLLHGNLSRSLTLVKKALRHFLEAGSPEWADRTRFLEGRLVFENGCYEDAIGIFKGIRDSPHGGNFPEKMDLLDAWVYRTENYITQAPALCPQNRVPDTDLFELEAMYFGGDHLEMAELSEKLSSIPPGEEFFYGTEQPDWRSGFAQCELLCFSWHELRNRMLGAYRSLAQSHLSPGEGQIAVHSMQQILQNSRFAEIDPCDTFYHYALFKILRQTGAGQIDLRTAASMAHKRLQVRSGRIDSPEIRRQYLARPYWNKALEEAAKELKLL